MKLILKPPPQEAPPQCEFLAAGPHTLLFFALPLADLNTNPENAKVVADMKARISATDDIAAAYVFEYGLDSVLRAAEMRTTPFARI